MTKRSLLSENGSGKTAVERVQIGLPIADHPVRVAQRLLESFNGPRRQLVRVVRVGRVQTVADV